MSGLKSLFSFRTIVLLTKSIFVDRDFNSSPFTMSFNEVSSNLVFEFTNTSANATSYRWDFGGSYSATTTNARIAYTSSDVTNFSKMAVNSVKEKYSALCILKLKSQVFKAPLPPRQTYFSCAHARHH